MSKRIVYRVLYTKKASEDGHHWQVRIGRSLLGTSETKAGAVSASVRLCNGEVEDGNTAQLVVHTKDGLFEYEHTYPRKSDPRRRKG